MNRGTKKSSTTNYKLRLSKDKNSTKDIPTKITIDSNIKIPDKKEDDKKVNETNKEDEQQKKKDKIIHENNLTVIQLLQNDLNKLEEENKLIDEEVNGIKNEEKDLMERIDQIKKDIEEEIGNLEELKDINDEKNRELLHLLHLRHQQIMQNANNLNRNINNEINNANSNPGQRRERPGDALNHFTLGDVMDGILHIANIHRESNNDDSPQFPLIFIPRAESNEEGPPMSYQQLQGLPSYNYQGRNSNEKCNICDFDLCFNDLVTRLSKCNHIFHKNCLVNRLSTRRSSKCPNCKVSII